MWNWLHVCWHRKWGINISHFVVSSLSWVGKFFTMLPGGHFWGKKHFSPYCFFLNVSFSIRFKIVSIYLCFHSFNVYLYSIYSYRIEKSGFLVLTCFIYTVNYMCRNSLILLHSEMVLFSFHHNEKLLQLLSVFISQMWMLKALQCMGQRWPTHKGLRKQTDCFQFSLCLPAKKYSELNFTL